jgi:hypothetical protein
MTLSGGSLASPVASAVTSPSDRFYVSDPYSRINAEGQLKAAASGNTGLEVKCSTSQKVEPISAHVATNKRKTSIGG